MDVREVQRVDSEIQKIAEERWKKGDDNVSIAYDPMTGNFLIEKRSQPGEEKENEKEDQRSH